MALLWAGRAGDVLAADGSRTKVTVEVLIFSGRPNPAWELQDTKKLETPKTKLKDAPEAFKEEPAGWTRLGFAGFRIHGGETLGLTSEIRVYQGVIKTGHGKDVRYRKDPVGLEQNLINETKRQALERPVKDAIADYEESRKGK